MTVRSCEYNLTNVYAVRGHMVESTDEVVLCADYEFMRDMRAVVDQPPAQPPSPNHADPTQCFQPSLTPLPQTPMGMVAFTLFFLIYQLYLSASPHPLLFSGFNQFLLQQSGCTILFHYSRLIQENSTFSVPMHQLTASYMQRQIGLPPPQPQSILLSAQQQQQQYAQAAQYPIQPQLYANALLQAQQQASLPLKQWLLADRSQSTELGSTAWTDHSTPPESDSPPPSVGDREEGVMNAMKTVSLAPSEPPTTPKTSAISPNPDESPIAHSVLAAAKKFNSAANG